ncbi:membrane protein insertion efficiency factor YidD [Candidatus Dependentiae bacterium]|nr:membrane protein insertion efficiency factor YidD [Candidatus Dependentiae bacterium]
MINQLLISLFQALRPFLGFASCKFPISCGNFAIMQLQDLPLRKAIPSIARQLVACNPFFNPKKSIDASLVKKIKTFEQNR